MATVDIHPECLEVDLAGIRDRRIREGILDKIATLEKEPGFARPLLGELRGHYRVTYGRYRIVYRWDPGRDHVLVWFVGPRGSETYEAAEKLLEKRRIDQEG